MLLLAETSKQRQIDIFIEPRFPPALNSHTADETKAPTLSAQESLKLRCGSE